MPPARTEDVCKAKWAIRSHPGGGEQRHVGAHREVVRGQRHDVVGQVPRDDVLMGDAGDGGSAAQAHDHGELVLQHVDHANDALLAIRGQRVEHRPADANARGTEGDGFEDVATTTDAAI
eukprot:CAMPEP_0177229084 /NCGR_PEP_ID=MMETSP0367-20130122/41503_1 /TAXON_ID=447022 ORGANISM="Scrippsiella hangoei-like, Strain SHHI-4" /NCGR_SAMPLE_ID=MMETSP0367 /ASSEMBLY_ACC=CAM_ASM_000362 /LENGTH=119 /DNA_ID=CAMNT_0018679445 /DNA_START=648 /DNA_END=1004 /DNA_ORIENTATION=+